MSLSLGIKEIALPGALIALYAVLLSAYFVPVVDNVDANGYFVSARIFQEDGRFSQVPPDDYAFIGRMWVANSRGEYYPKYPPLYPALAGLVMMGLGMGAGFYVVPVCALLALLGMYVLCRTRFSAWLSVLGALALAVNPVFNTFAFRQMAHAPSMCFLIWAYAVLLWALRREAVRLRPVLIFISGLLLGCSAGIRYTNVLMALPPLVLFVARPAGSRSKTVKAYLAGLAIPMALLAGYHWRAFGSPLRTGYALTGEQIGFGWGYVTGNVLRYGKPLLTHLAGPVALLSVIGLVLVWLRDRTRAAFYSVWLLPLSLLYMAYYWETQLFPEAFLRFLLPALVPGILLALVCLDAILRRMESRRALRAIVMVAFAASLVWWGMAGTFLRVEREYIDRVARKRMVDLISDTVPEGSAVFGHPVLLMALDAKRAYTLYPFVILDRIRINEAVIRAGEGYRLDMLKERAALLEKDFG